MKSYLMMAKREGTPDPFVYPVIWTIVFVACLGLSDCKSHEIIAHDLAVHPGLQAAQAQALIAEWKENHPGHTVKRISVFPGRGA